MSVSEEWKGSNKQNKMFYYNTLVITLLNVITAHHGRVGVKSLLNVFGTERHIFVKLGPKPQHFFALF